MGIEYPDYDEPPPKETGPFYCTICHENEVDALDGFDTCDECLRKRI